MSISVASADGTLRKVAHSGFANAAEITEHINDISLLKQNIVTELNDNTTNEDVPGALFIKSELAQMSKDLNQAIVDATPSTMTGATSSVNGSAGLVPAPASGNQAKFLRGDGTWQTPTDTNTTYSAVNFTLSSGASGTVNLTNSRIKAAQNPLCTLYSGSAADYAKISSITTKDGSIDVVLSSALSAELVITLHGIPE